MASPYTGNAPVTRTGGNGLAVAGLVCGIIGVFLFDFILGPLALIFGGVGLRNANHGAGHRGMALAAVILGIVDIVLFVVIIAAASHHSASWHFG
ncbi:DUF4190 domain-containing protein [Actinospica robiniae]|uniref:DUF4190 domain-containing protein n=1 Tax=Actinospica robiniae TaxID=304901 RepID=UPI0003F4F0DC|nr:DUF4190 domain-containing protein [Actinospica robiniae]